MTFTRMTLAAGSVLALVVSLAQAQTPSMSETAPQRNGAAVGTEAGTAVTGNGNDTGTNMAPSPGEAAGAALTPGNAAPVQPSNGSAQGLQRAPRADRN